MARKVSVLLTDDLSTDEVPAAETIKFALDGHTYEIDLSEGNAKKMRDTFGMYVGAARRAGSAATRRASSSGGGRPNVDRERTKEIRAWAESAGLMPAGRKGRIPSAIVEQWENRHTGTQSGGSPTKAATPSSAETTMSTPKPAAPSTDVGKANAITGGAGFDAPEPAAKAQRNTAEPKKAAASKKETDKEKASA